MDNQQAFTRSLKGIRGQQYRRAVDKDGRCTYIVPDTPAVRCGVGHLLTTDTARNTFGPISHILEHHCPANDAVLKELEGVDTELLIRLQNAHDTALKLTRLNVNGEHVKQEHGAAVYEQQMAEIAELFGLQYDEPVRR
jgi:hypothetical protein